MTKLGDIAYTRSGDKGASANIGVIALEPRHYETLVKNLTEGVVAEYFKELQPTSVRRYLLPNLHALNFVLEDALDGGGSYSLRCDAQGKALGQALLEIKI